MLYASTPNLQNQGGKTSLKPADRPKEADSRSAVLPWKHIASFKEEVPVAQTAQSVTFPSGTRKLDATLALPKGDAPFLLFLAIHEKSGSTENIKEINR